MHAAVLAIHIASGTVGLALGPIAMFSPKRRGRHTRVGVVYFSNMTLVVVSAIGLAALNWSELWWFLPIALFSFANALLGYLAVRIRWRGWLRQHIAGMGGSYIALTTALLVVNAGGALYVWFIPTIIGVPLIAWATARAAQGPLAPALRRAALPR